MKLPTEVKWFYARPTRKYRKVTEMPFWHFRGRYTKDDHTVCDGKWVDANTLVADGGWQEIQARLDELCPDAEARHRE